MGDHFREPNPLDVGAQIKTGLDGKLYVVFPNACALWLYMERDPHRRYEGKRIFCFGQYDNAICLEDA
jgi:hypothetical protein